MNEILTPKSEKRSEVYICHRDNTTVALVGRQFDVLLQDALSPRYINHKSEEGVVRV